MSNPPSVWPVLSYVDAPAAIEFLTTAFGFETAAVFTREDDDAIVDHAQLRWPLGGGVMMSSAGVDDTPFRQRHTGNDSIYVVCDEPDALFERATGAGRRGGRRPEGRGLRLPRLHRPRPRRQPLELRDLPGRVISRPRG